MITPLIGPHLTADGVYFCVWAPERKQVELHLTCPHDSLYPMKKRGEYWECTVPGIGAGARYLYRLDETEDHPDPASPLQPDGVHGPSQVVDSRFDWTDSAWRGIELHQYIIYELHVGTYTPEGTFEAIIPHLENLKELGITAIELMPVGQFPGTRNWGYDGVYPFAPQFSYGGTIGLKKLVNAAHNLGIAIILDVIYNHLGPEGNYFSRFGPYFTNIYKTPWGDAINYDGPYSRAVRDYFLTNAEYWIREFHIDGLRLDATHEMHDSSPIHILAETQKLINRLSHELNRHIHIIAETDANDIRYLMPPEQGGYGLNSQWLDDFHHSVYTQMSGTNSLRYNPDYTGFHWVHRTFAQGFVYTGQYCPSRKRSHGISSRDIAPERFVVFMQNHDQVGNKPAGIRLAAEASFEAVKMTAAATILSPYLPMIFMGEEYLETRPFQFFADHSDPELLEAVREGRRRDFMLENDTTEFPDPFAIETFNQCVIDHQQIKNPRNAAAWLYYKELFHLRRTLPAICPVQRDQMRVHTFANQDCLLIRREQPEGATLLIISFADQPQQLIIPPDLLHWPCHDRTDYPAPQADKPWLLALDSADTKWHGPGQTAPDLLSLDQPSLTISAEAAHLFVIHAE